MNIYSISAMTVVLLILWALWKLLHLLADEHSSLRTQLFFASLLVFVLAGYLWFSCEDPFASFRISDSLEYAIGSHELVRNGSYQLPLAGDVYPPRYAPWFSSIFLSPVFSVFSFSGGLAHAWYVIAFYSIAAMLAAYIVGLSLGSGFGGALAAGFVMLLPGFRYYSTQVMSEIPTVAFLLLLFAVYQGLRKVRKGAAKLWLLAGLLLMLATLLRPLSIGFIIPFAIMLYAYMRHMVLSLPVGLGYGALLFAPVLTAAGMHAAYNQYVFGNFARSGYHYWTSIPYDYPGLLLSFAYLFKNLQVLLLGTGVVVLFALLFVVPTRKERAPEQRKEELQSGLLYILSGSSLYLLFHLFYFYQSSRFFLPFEVLLATFVGGMLGRLIPAERVKVGTVCSVCLFAASCMFATLFLQEPRRGSGSVAGLLGVLPESAILVSDENPLLLSKFSPRANLFPWSRKTEYASKLVLSGKSILNPAPTNPFEHRDERLLSAGGKDVFPLVAQESLEFLEDRIEEGKPVFVFDGGNEPEMMAQLGKAFVLEEVTPSLFKVEIPEFESSVG